jgi:hypothetical protein
MPRWAVALLVTLAIEVPLATVLFPGQRAKMAAVAAIMNVATNVTLNVWLPRVALLRGGHVLPGELLALVAEAAVYALASRDLPRSLVAAGLGNALSFAAGFWPVVWKLAA